MSKYDPRAIEKKWQKKWEKAQAFHAAEDSSKKKEYLLVEFPYPSGDGLHVGHVRSFTAMDVVARKRRMQGENVLYPIGWDAFGLPTENYAIKMGLDPRVVTKENTGNFRRQLKSLGLSFDWQREVNTTDPAYYKWTQWIFLQLFKKGLAYKAKTLVNWCPQDKIVLANEEVVTRSAGSGQAAVCERCGTPVEKREKEQWMLAITKYAQRLYDDLDTVDYIPAAKIGQRNWIGPSEGAEIKFKVWSKDDILTDVTNIVVFTTRPDTLFGATYLVLSPEYSQMETIRPFISNWKEVGNYIQEAKNKSEIERTAEGKEKTGVEIKGIKATNPCSKKEIPIFVADYVLGGYGTGAIMAVPAHDERDFEFAEKYDLPLIKVNDGFAVRVYGNTKENARIIELTDESYIRKEKVGSYSATHLGDKWIHTFIFKTAQDQNDFLSLIQRMEFKFAEVPYSRKDPDAKVMNSQEFDGLFIPDAIKKMGEKYGKLITTYKLRDWVFSRQRYWGEPIPMIYCQACQEKARDGWVPVPEKDLPVLLPEVKKYQPTDTGESPLANINEWVNTTCPKCGAPAKRETDVMPNWAGSSWYYLRYCDPHNDKAFASKENLKYWTPVDWYNGGMEHTTLHLLYSRFWHKVLFDLGLVPTNEPYAKRTSHGLILAEDGSKMSKSKGNIVNPDELVERFGADSLRLFEMFLGPFDQPVSWNSDSITGVHRFLERVWKLQEKVSPEQNPVASPQATSEGFAEGTETLLNQTIDKVTRDIETLKMNTAVSSLMILLNHLSELPQVPRAVYKIFLQLLAPFAPHIVHELAEAIGLDRTDWEQWPVADAAKLIADKIVVAVQINGTKRATIELSADVSESRAVEIARAAVQKWTEGTEIKNTVFIPGRIINFVVNIPDA